MSATPTIFSFRSESGGREGFKSKSADDSDSAKILNRRNIYLYIFLFILFFIISSSRLPNTFFKQKKGALHRVYLGEELYKALEQRENRTISSASRQTKRRAILVISADLAHTHERWGPYGWSPAAAPFDKACAQWASTLDGELLTKIAAQYVNDVCNFLLVFEISKRFLK